MDSCIPLYTNNIEVIRILITAGTDLEARGVTGRTILIDAAQKDNKDLFEFLIQAGADLNAKNDYDQTAFICALMRADGEIIKLFFPPNKLS